mgnify:CR=1 FL=1
MRLVKLKLREPNPYWILNPIVLSQKDNISPFIDADKLPQKAIDAINKSVDSKVIFLLDNNGDIINGRINDINIFDCNHISADDLEDSEEQDMIPEFISVTVPIEEEKDDEEDAVEEVSVEVKQNAKILLSKNGNTVKATIKSLPNDNDTLTLLHICHDLESSNKNRSGILKVIEQKIMEC